MLSKTARLCYVCGVLSVNTTLSKQPGAEVLGSPRPEELQRETCTSATPVVQLNVAWWQWPHVLSLDAPIVAVVWQHWWERAGGAKTPWLHDAILALGVWMIYLADRLADTRRAAPQPPETARHAFSARHRRVLWPLFACVATGLALLTPAVLPAGQFAAGLGLLLIAGGYFWLIHRRRPSHWAALLPKEAFVGAIFAAGTIFFVGWPVGLRHVPVLIGALLFSALCFFNCALITQWEGSDRDRCEPTSLLNAFPWLDGRLGFGCMWLAVLGSVLACSGLSLVFLPIALGALALAWLDHQRALFSTDALRVLADLALLAPLIWGGW